MANRGPSDTPAALFAQRQRVLFRSLPGALVGKEEPIHELRVAGRRLRLALSLLAARPTGRRVRRLRDTIRQLGLAAGRARDFDVMLDLLDRRLIDLGRFAHEQILLRRRLRAAQRRSRQRMVETLLDTDVAGLRRGLRALQPAGVVGSAELAERVPERARAVALAVAGLWRSTPRLNVGTLHEIRRHVRRLRYLAEIVQELFAASPRTAEELKKLQEYLGAIRDNSLLADWLRLTAARAAARGEATLPRAARGLARHFRLQARQLHAAWQRRPATAIAERCARRLARSAGGGSPARPRATRPART